MTTPPLRAFFGLSSFTLLAALTACGSSVVGGAGASGTTGPEPGDPPPGARAAIATSFNCGYGYGSTSSGWTGGSSGGGTGGWGASTGSTGSMGGSAGSTGWGGAGGSTGGAGGWGGDTGGTGGVWGGQTDCVGDPVPLTIEIGDPLPTCSDPTIETPCGGHFGVTITVPPELQVKGSVIPLSSPSVSAYFSESGAPYGSDPTSCPGGGGSFISGTLTIQEIYVNSVTFTLEGTQPFELGAPSADGLYYAVRCW